MAKKVNRKLVLEDGGEYYGYAFGDICDTVCEIVFNTSMVGYQEIVSDPSYTYQAVVMTYPLIGNYGVADDDYEARTPTLGALVVSEYNDTPSNFRYTRTLSEILEENRIPGIEGIDTRKLTRSIRDFGSRRALITSADTPLETALETIMNTPEPHDAVRKVSCRKRWYSRTANHKFNVVAVDCGVRLSLIRNLNARKCNLTVVPFDTAAEVIERMNPDGIVLPNGPGDPKDVTPVIELVRQLRGKYPIFGAGLGHQLIALACGADTYKLKFGHHGGNHPVKNLKTGKIEITSQNHNYAVDLQSLDSAGLEATHVNLLDGTAEGITCRADQLFGVQYHPESATGASLLDQFINSMREAKENA